MSSARHTLEVVGRKARSLWARRLILFGVPAAAALMFHHFLGSISNDVFPVAISALALVSALLFSAQFSIFSVAASIDKEKIAREFENAADFKNELRKVNKSVAILISIAAASSLTLLAFFASPWGCALETLVSVYIVTFFFCKLFALIPEVYSILDMGYRKL